MLNSCNWLQNSYKFWKINYVLHRAPNIRACAHIHIQCNLVPRVFWVVFKMAVAPTVEQRNNWSVAGSYPVTFRGTQRIVGKTEGMPRVRPSHNPLRAPHLLPKIVCVSSLPPPKSHWVRVWVCGATAILKNSQKALGMRLYLSWRLLLNTVEPRQLEVELPWEIEITSSYRGFEI